MSKLNKQRRQLKLLGRLKKGKKHALAMMLVLLSSGCIITQGTSDNLCLWADPIRLLTTEVDSLSIESLRQIDDFNEELREQCK